MLKTSEKSNPNSHFLILNQLWKCLEGGKECELRTNPLDPTVPNLHFDSCKTHPTKQPLLAKQLNRIYFVKFSKKPTQLTQSSVKEQPSQTKAVPLSTTWHLIFTAFRQYPSSDQPQAIVPIIRLNAASRTPKVQIFKTKERLQHAIGNIPFLGWPSWQ